MPVATVYDAATGTLLRLYEGSQPELQALPGEAVYHAELDLRRQRIDVTTGEPVEHRPDAPEATAVWSEAQWRWVTRAERNGPLLRAIQELESRQPRALREAVLTGDKTRLQEIETAIAALRARLEA